MLGDPAPVTLHQQPSTWGMSQGNYGRYALALLHLHKGMRSSCWLRSSGKTPNSTMRASCYACEAACNYAVPTQTVSEIK